MGCASGSSADGPADAAGAGGGAAGGAGASGTAGTSGGGGKAGAAGGHAGASGSGGSAVGVGGSSGAAGSAGGSGGAGTGGASGAPGTGGAAGASGTGGAGNGGAAGGPGGSGGAGGTTGGSAGSATAGTGGTSAGGASAGGSGGSSGEAGAGGSTVGSGTIVPLYSDPTDAAWALVASAKKSHPTVTVRAVINPNSGPGSGPSSDYSDGIMMLRDAGVIVLGYVHTSGGDRLESDLETEIDDYVSWYPQVQGIFFDEMSNDPNATVKDGWKAPKYYMDLSNYAKGKGLTITVGNPGTESDPMFVGTVDTIMIYEDGGLPNLASLGGWHTQFDKSNFGIIPYNVSALDSAFVASARNDVGFIYLTDDDLPNPWDTLSPYFGPLLDSLQ